MLKCNQGHLLLGKNVQVEAGLLHGHREEGSSQMSARDHYCGGVHIGESTPQSQACVDVGVVGSYSSIKADLFLGNQEVGIVLYPPTNCHQRSRYAVLRMCRKNLLVSGKR